MGIINENPVKETIKIPTATMNDLFLKTMSEILNKKESHAFLSDRFHEIPNGDTLIEQLINDEATDMSDDYDRNTDYWQLAKNKASDGFFLYPLGDKHYTIRNKNTNQENIVDARVFGFMNNVTVFGKGSFVYYESKPALAKLFAQYYYSLRNAFWETVDALVHDIDSKASAEEKEQIEVMGWVVWSCLK